MAGEILGHIDCPSCGTVGGMRITLDKNREPFGFCEAECNQQLRVGGNARRVALFVALYPWASGKIPTAGEKIPTAGEKAQLPLQEKPPSKRGFSMGL